MCFVAQQGASQCKVPRWPVRADVLPVDVDHVTGAGQPRVVPVIGEVTADRVQGLRAQRAVGAEPADDVAIGAAQALVRSLRSDPDQVRRSRNRADRDTGRSHRSIRPSIRRPRHRTTSLDSPDITESQLFSAARGTSRSSDRLISL